MRSVLGDYWRDLCWSWNFDTLATWWEELTHLKRPWCWEGLWAGGEGDDRGWDGWMASLTRWTWVWVNSGSWWWTGRPGALCFMGLQRVRHDWVTELNWTELNWWHVESFLSVPKQDWCSASKKKMWEKKILWNYCWCYYLYKLAFSTGNLTALWSQLSHTNAASVFKNLTVNIVVILTFKTSLHCLLRQENDLTQFCVIIWLGKH